MTAPVAATSRTPIAREFRAAKAALGLRQAQIWVPDTRSPAYIAECKRQSALIASKPREWELAEELAKRSDTSGWE
ncbi:antitoxin MazE family protein [Cupriavidus plantarum]|uniref:antitoxin MazE family protein n=1 Tax=Cupriavidus plantarum TaxID=942865 RepID=UPI001C62B8FF